LALQPAPLEGCLMFAPQPQREAQLEGKQEPLGRKTSAQVGRMRMEET
jgi:hypothetical protein